RQIPEKYTKSGTFVRYLTETHDFPMLTCRQCPPTTRHPLSTVRSSWPHGLWACPQSPIFSSLKAPYHTQEGVKYWFGRSISRSTRTCVDASTGRLLMEEVYKSVRSSLAKL